MIIQNTHERELLQKGGRILARILADLAQRVRSGVNAAELDREAERNIRAAGGVPSFKGYQTKGDRMPYPATLCVSVNDELVHALPTKEKIFKEGDLVGLDIGMRWPAENGLFLDTAVTVPVAAVSKDALRLLRATREALEIGIRAAHAGGTTGDIGAAVGAYLARAKLGIVRNLAGHGVGREVHEEPLIPNFGKRGTGPELAEGMVIAIEPMATLGTGAVELAKDGWTFASSDGALAAHFEHTVVITKNGAEVLTA